LHLEVVDYCRIWIIYYLYDLNIVLLTNILSIMGKYSVVKVPSDILKLAAQNVAILRKELKLTQLDLAEKSGVSHGSIKRFERFGKISFESLLKIAEALDRLHEFESLFLSQDTKRLEGLFSSK